MITEAPAKIDQSDTSPSAHILIKYLDKDQESPITKNNKLKLYTDGHDKFRDLSPISARPSPASTSNTTPSITTPSATNSSSF